MSAPLVSIVMPVHDGLPYLPAAVNSILWQSHQDFELIVVNDGSTDGSHQYVEGIGDPRIQLLHTKRRGLVPALNLGLSQARGTYIARMDADDVSREDRFASQIEVLRTSRGVGVVCSNARIIDERGRVVGVQRERWPSMDFVREGLLYQRPMKPIIHPSVMARRSLLESIGGYRDFPSAEDHDLWLRTSRLCSIVRVQEDLIDYRIHPKGTSRTQSLRQEVSSLTAVVCALIYGRSGIDLVADRPDLLLRVRTDVEALVLCQLVPPATDFRNARASVRDRRYATAVGRTALGILRHRSAFRPDGARRVACRIVNTVAHMALTELEAGK